MHGRLHIMARAAGLLVTAVAGLTLAASAATAAVPAWTTYDHDAARSAVDPDSTTPVAPTAAWTTAALDGPVWAQPLVYGSLVYVATENDTVYALNAATGAVVWQRSVGTAVSASSLPCGDISPTVGITSTPVIDPASGRIYAVADVLSGGAVQHRLVALDLNTGDMIAGFPVAVDPPGQDPKAVLQRGALALDAGRVIIPYGGNDGDCSTYHGWLVSVAESGAGTQPTFEVDSAQGESQGAIWGAGDGPSQDAAGDLFVETGNGNSSTADYQESVVELGAGVNVIAHWTAPNWKTLDNTDTDLGSSEPLPLPGGLLFVAGKDGIGRLVSSTGLGTSGQVFSAQVCGSGGVYGASLYRAGVIYIPCSGGLRAVSLSGAGFTPLAGFTAPGGASGPPIFAGGLVWSTGWRGSGLLYGLDPATGAIRFQTNLGGFEHFATPSAGGGRLFVAAGSKVSALTVATLPPPAVPPPVVTQPAPRLSAVRLAPRRFTARHGSTLHLTLSQIATVRVQVSRVISGRIRSHRCRVGAHRGRRCTVTHRARRFSFHGQTGRDRFRVHTTGLRAGDYAATIVAVGTSGRASRTVTVRFQILRPRH